MAWISDRRVVIFGKLSGMGQRDLRKLLARHGSALVNAGDEPTLIVVGDESWPSERDASPTSTLDEATRHLVRQGRAELVAESVFWERLGLVETENAAAEGESAVADVRADVRRLYTPAMLATLLGVPLASVRTWQRRELLRPTRLVRKLAYFDFTQVTAARRLAALAADGVSGKAMERRVAALARRFPTVTCPLGELPLVVAEGQLFLRQGESLVDIAGQYRLDFDATDGEAAPLNEGDESPKAPRNVLAPAEFHAATATPEEIMAAVAEFEELGDLAAATDACRTALVAGGPSAETCFRLAELLYRQNDLAAARERYYMAVELDEEFVEARANLGCLLAEEGRLELAVAALEGALACHATYADVHYHLARTLDELGRDDEAQSHWCEFLELAPDSPWAEEARGRVGGEF